MNLIMFAKLGLQTYRFEIYQMFCKPKQTSLVQIVSEIWYRYSTGKAHSPFPPTIHQLISFNKLCSSTVGSIPRSCPFTVKICNFGSIRWGSIGIAKPYKPCRSGRSPSTLDMKKCRIFTSRNVPRVCISIEISIITIFFLINQFTRQAKRNALLIFIQAYQELELQ